MDSDDAFDAADARITVTSVAPAFSRQTIAAELTAMVGTGPRMLITHARAGARRVLVVAGTVDVDGATRLAEILRQAGRSHEPVAIDVCHARLQDASGIALLVNAVRRLQSRGADVTLVCPPGQVRSALQRAGVARRVRIVADREMLAAVAPPRSPVAAVASGAVQVRRQRTTTWRRRSALLTDATLAIEARFAEPDLALRDVARQIATSERQLQRVLAELADSAFRDELAAVRMQHAARLLQASDLTISEIARRVGYRQPAQFAKAFRRHHGSSPTVFRRIADADTPGGPHDAVSPDRAASTSPLSLGPRGEPATGVTG
jgi:AraC family transcriptional regulator, regulatory protein of adaptative response / methylphosphotriester-DNA alkyltransferase methyltransferase